MKITALTLSILFTLHSMPALGDESFERCAAQKNRQLALMQKIRTGPAATSRHKSRSKKQFNAVDAQTNVDEIDEWLWRNCRSYANELRTIEQQHM